MAVDHDGGVHGHPPAGAEETTAAQQNGGANATGGDHDGVGAYGERFAGDVTAHALGAVASDQDLFGSGPGPELGSGSDGFVDIGGRVPLGAATAAKHAVGAAGKWFRLGGAHEF